PPKRSPPRRRGSTRRRVVASPRRLRTLPPRRPLLSRTFLSTHTAATGIYTLSLHDALPICSAASLRQNCVTVFSFSKNHFSSPSGRWSIVLLISSWGSTL